MRRLHLYLLVLLLTVTGLGIFAWKAEVLDFPILPSQRADSWRFEIRADLQLDGEPAIFSTYVPQTQGSFGVTDETYLSSGFGLTRTTDDLGNELAVWSVRDRTGPATLIYQADIYRFSSDMASDGPKELSPVLEIGTEELSGTERVALEQFVENLEQGSADTETFVAQLVSRLNAENPRDYEVLLFGSDGPSPQRRAEVAQKALRMYDVPARAVHGVELGDIDREAELYHWIEILMDGQWQAYSLEGQDATMPENLLPLWRGITPQMQLSGAELSDMTLSYAAQSRPRISLANLNTELQNSFVGKLTFYQLPVDTQAVYRVLMLVPLGALVIVILRQVVGLKTFGTFMPVLIALAFRETQLVTGLLMFSGLVAVGLFFRFYFERLKLLFVPRLSAVLTIVILIMAVASTLLETVRLGMGLSIALFPIVILAMIIERMSIVWEEYGPVESIKEGLGSALAAVAAYFVMNIWEVEHLLFTFPELLLVILALMLLFGRYTGYRVIELYRFRSLMKQKSR
ncbi:UUP1 family membrane protein [Fodinicurvata halophila]|uniref:UUP1 family membrane protein n=1 Tax=Fodinicurvata halophila TaxID=1419723 RepID=A0ABV8UHN0_9PROT